MNEWKKERNTELMTMNEWMNESYENERKIDWINENEWINEWINEGMNHMIEWLNEGMNDWMIEWMNDWMNE